MPSEREKMLTGALYDPLDRELVAGRERARDLCQALNATREGEADARRAILQDLFGRGAGCHRLAIERSLASCGHRYGASWNASAGSVTDVVSPISNTAGPGTVASRRMPPSSSSRSSE